MKTKLLEYRRWLDGDGGHKYDLTLERFYGLDLRFFNLSGMNLHGADLRGTDLRVANLRGANLSCVDLSGVDLSEADLTGANLTGANLTGANFNGANLRCADLSRAKLRMADLTNANLKLARLSMANLTEAIDGNVCRMDFGGWSICIRSSFTAIGCETRPNAWWLAASDSEIHKLDYKALSWWKVHGEAIKGVIKCVTAKT